MKRIIGILALVALVAACGVLGGASSGSGSNGNKTYTFQSLPQNLDDLKAMPGADLKDPYAVAALTMAALTRYETSPEDCFEMLDWLKGPENLSTYERQFIRDRLQGKGYKPRSFFAGATPANNYTPSRPYKITPSSNPYSFQEEGWATIHVKSGGADNVRPIKLRKKPSTGQWFLNDIQCLSDIRLPANEDKWY